MRLPSRPERLNPAWTAAAAGRTRALAVFLSGGLCAALALAGCKSVSPYISPRITGRVVDARTRQPVADVQVRRMSARPPVNPDQPLKGGQAMERPAPILTGADGCFVLSSERALAFFRTLGWYSVTVAFERAGYEGEVTNFTVANATNTSAGEPLVPAGDILLSPRAD
jgi:hypothetical protein